MSHILHYLAVFAFGAVALNLTGCVNLGKGTASSTRFYTLNSMADNRIEQAMEQARHEVYLGIHLIKLPKYLNRSQIVTRIGPNEHKLAEFARWSEPLTESVARVIAENLSVLVPTVHVAVHPWSPSTPIDYQLMLEFTRLDGTFGSESILIAQWKILGADGEQLLSTTKSSFSASIPTTEYSVLAAAISMNLVDLSSEIAEAITALLKSSDSR